MQDPDMYLKELGVELAGWMDQTAPAVLDPDHRSFVNHEAFFFTDAEGKRAFDADPARYCGMVTDPVDRERFRPGDDSPRFDYDGRVFLFASDRTFQAFTAAPDSFFLPSLRMMPKEGEIPEGEGTG